VSDGPKTLSFAERVALYACATEKERARVGLEAFATASRDRALAFADQVLSWDSPTRQARLTREFGAPRNALERLRVLILEAPPALRLAIAEQLPPSVRAHFAHLRAREPIAPALAALAARLVREATR
jgi:hypothetical protein